MKSVADLTRKWKLFFYLTEEFEVTPNEEDAQYVIVQYDINTRQPIYFLKDTITGERFALKVIKDCRPLSEDEILKDLVERCTDSVISVVKLSKHKEYPEFKFILMQDGLDFRSFLARHSLNVMVGGRIDNFLKYTMLRMTMSLWHVNRCGYHHRDVRLDNFVIMPHERVTPRKRTAGVLLGGAQYTPQLIDFGLSMKHNAVIPINSQDFVRPPNFVYLNSATPENEFLYQDSDEIFALGMTFLDLLGLAPNVEAEVPQHLISSLAAIYLEQEKAATNEHLISLLKLKPSLQAIRLILYFGWPPETFTEFHASPLAAHLRAFKFPTLEQFPTWNYFEGMCKLHLAEEPLLFEMLQMMLKWNRSDRVQNFELLISNYFQPWLDQ